MWTAFVAFWTAVATLLIVATLAPEPTTPPRPPAPAEDALPVFTLDELAQHATEDDCWMAIRGTVYDFTEYIPQHPTAPDIMTDWCGKEATEAYETKTYGVPHSELADQLLENYEVGLLAVE
jgi:hypothetical protein